MLTLGELNMSRTNPQRWAQTIWFGLFVLGGFAWFYYPHIKASWGGGRPVSVVICLAKDAPVSPGKQVQAILLDESDAGFYIVPAQEKKALFLPRNAVSLIYFSDKTSDSTLLHNSTP